MTRRSTKIPTRWLRLFAVLPGYDPVATAADGEYFDVSAADMAVRFFREHIRHVEGEMAGQPYTLEPHEAAIVGCVWGWKRANGKRRYREVFYFVPRKNSKTTLSAGLVCLVLFCDAEPGAQLYSTAADRDQAALVFRVARSMVLADEQMSDMAKIYQKSIVVRDRFYRPVSADVGTKHGYNTHCAINDELHAHKNPDLIEVIETSVGARSQPLLIHITTSDFEREGSICNRKHDYASKVRDGVIEDSSFLPAIWEASRDDDWTSPAVWAKANPNLGKSLKLEYMQAACAKAKEMPAYENTFKRLHLNIRTEQESRWLALETWDANAGPDDWKALRTLATGPCYAGLDLASTRDLTALVLYWPASGIVLPYFWIPSDNVHGREHRDKVPFSVWLRQTSCESTPGNATDYDVIRRRINELGQTYHISEIAVDRWASAQIQQDLTADGFKVIPFGQGFGSMGSPTKELERLLLAGKLRHGAHPVLRWNASNVMVDEDAAGNIKPAKDKSSEKIDGIVALVMAIGRAQAAQVIGSIYEDETLAHRGQKSIYQIEADEAAEQELINEQRRAADARS